MSQTLSLSLLFVLLMASAISKASPTLMTYQGRILKSNGTPFEGSNVSFLFQVTDPTGQCVMYQEQLDGVSMTNSGGVFDLAIGSSGKQFPLSGTFTLLDTFNNTTPSFACGVCSSAGTSYSCSNGTSTYTPSLGDHRRLRVSFHDGLAWRTISPDNEIRSVPFSGFSLSAQKLGDNIASDFLLKAGLPTCTGNTFLSWNGSSLSCASVSVSDTNITDVAGTKVSGNISGNSAGFTGSLAGDVSGTQGANTVDRIKGRAVASSAPNVGDTLVWNGTEWAPTAPGSSSNFGGMYFTVSGACNSGNPLNGGACSCPSGFSTASIINTNGEGGRNIYWCYK